MGYIVILLEEKGEYTDYSATPPSPFQHIIYGWWVSQLISGGRGLTHDWTMVDMALWKSVTDCWSVANNKQKTQFQQQFMDLAADELKGVHGYCGIWNNISPIFRSIHISNWQPNGVAGLHLNCSVNFSVQQTESFLTDSASELQLLLLRCSQLLLFPPPN